MKTIRAADLFCGAGGTSTGLVEACTELGFKTELTAINHWDIAVATHTANHPKSRHLCASLDSINPRDLYKEGELDLLWASPECTHHSIARGGKPINDQSRATAWCVVRWAEALRPNIILVENVKEFVSWGPIGANGKPNKSRRGEVFHAWKSCLESLGYRVEWRILCAADFGDPTTRARLFVYCVRGRRRIVWPEPSHAPEASQDMFGSRAKWVPARDIIDWSIQGKSIYTRKRPLAAKTLNRIFIGLEKFGLKPFIVPQQSFDNRVRSLEKPLPTVTTESRGVRLIEPYLVHLRGNCNAKPLDRPAPALTAGGGHLALVEPFLIDCCHGNGAELNGDKRRAHSLEKPLGALHCANRFALCEPLLLGQQSAAAARPVSQPAPTVATAGAISLIEPYLVSIDHQSSKNGCKSAKDPLSTISTKARHALCKPYLVKYFGQGGNTRTVDEPLPTVTAKDRFGLVTPTVEILGERYLLDIRFRMLKPHELAAAQGFPRDYKFTGNTTQVVRQIGNAVPKNLAKALVKAALTQSPNAETQT